MTISSTSSKLSIPDIDGFEHHFKTVNRVNLHYMIGGNLSGKPILLWHGFLGTSQSWKKVMLLLAEAGYAVLVPDMRGYGDSEKPEGIEGYDAQNLSKDFRDLVKLINFGDGRQITLVAHDMGAAPALLWCADFPQEVKSLLYMEMVVMLDEILQSHLAFKREVIESALGTMWWWILPHANEALELFFVDKEREFLNWFYHRTTADKKAIGKEEIDEVLRTFSGREGVNGAFGIYRAVFKSIEQTEPLSKDKISVPVVAVGGAHSLGEYVGQMVSMVGSNVETVVIQGAGHFLVEEKPAEVFELISRASGINYTLTM